MYNVTKDFHIQYRMFYINKIMFYGLKTQSDFSIHNKCFWAANQSVRMISEESRDNETASFASQE